MPLEPYNPSQLSQMRILPNLGAQTDWPEVQNFGPPLPDRPEESSFLGAAARQYNIFGTLAYADITKSAPDPNFDLFAAIEENRMQQYATEFVGVRNQQDFNDVKESIALEERDRAKLDEYGLATNLLAAFGFGILDPFIALPVLRVFTAGRAGASLARRAADFALTGAISEIPAAATMTSTQALMTPAEGALQVSAAAVLSSLIGVPLSRATSRAIDAEVVKPFKPSPIALREAESTVGAAQIENETQRVFRTVKERELAGIPEPTSKQLAAAEGKAQAAAEEKLVGFYLENSGLTGEAYNKAAAVVGEYVRRIDQTLVHFLSPSPEVRRIGQKVAANQLLYYKHMFGEATPVSIESKLNFLQGTIRNAEINQIDQIYADAFLRGGKAASLRTAIRGSIGARVRGSITHADFQHMISGAIRHMDATKSRDITKAEWFNPRTDKPEAIPPEAIDAVNKVIDYVYSRRGTHGHILNESVEHGLLHAPGTTPDGLKPVAKEWWLHRIVNRNKAQAQQEQFRAALRQNVTANLTAARDELHKALYSPDDHVKGMANMTSLDDMRKVIDTQLQLVEELAREAGGRAGQPLDLELPKREWLDNFWEAMDNAIQNRNALGRMTDDERAQLDTMREKPRGEYNPDDMRRLRGHAEDLGLIFKDQLEEQELIDRMLQHVDRALNTIDRQADRAQDIAGRAKSRLSALAGEQDKTLAEIDKLEGQIADLKPAEDVPGLTGEINALKTKLDKINTEIRTLNKTRTAQHAEAEKSLAAFMNQPVEAIPATEARKPALVTYSRTKPGEYNVDALYALGEETKPTGYTIRKQKSKWVLYNNDAEVGAFKTLNEATNHVRDKADIQEVVDVPVRNVEPKGTQALGRDAERDIAAVAATNRRLDDLNSQRLSVLDEIATKHAAAQEAGGQVGVKKLTRRQQRAANLKRDVERVEAKLRTAESKYIDFDIKANELAMHATDLRAKLRTQQRAVRKMRSIQRSVNKLYDKYMVLDEMTPQDIESIVQQMYTKFTDPQLDNPALPEPFMEVMLRQRGPAGPFRRKMPIADKAIEPWLENNYEVIMRAAWKRAMPDIELLKGSGDVAGKGWRDQIINSRVERRAQIAEEFATAEAKGDTKAMSRLNAESNKIEADIKREVDALDTSVRRLRGLDGIPADPRSIANRSVQTLLGLTLLSKLGMVMFSSLSDPAKIVMRQGIRGVFGDIAFPLARAMMTKQGRAAMRLSNDEFKLADIFARWWLDSRFQKIGELQDDFLPVTRFEKTVDGMVKYFGLASGMSPWNNFWKVTTAYGVQNRMLKTIRKIGLGQKVSQHDLQRLALRHIGLDEARKIYANEWQHIADSDGLLVANTNDWTNRDLAERFLSALKEEADATIVTPGLDRPKWMTQGWLKLLGQFRSFDAASVQRTLLPLAQERNAAQMYGLAFMTGLGMLAVWSKAQISGRDIGDMNNPDDLAALMYAGFDQAGALPWLLTANNMLEDLGRSAGYSNVGLRAAVEAATGYDVSRPTKYNSDLATVLFPAASTAKDILRLGFSTASLNFDERTLHSLRRILPFQNLFWARQGFDAAEEAIARRLGP